MSIRARLAKLEHPITSPCFQLASRQRIAKLNPKDASPVAETIAQLEAAGDRLSLRLARALTRTLKD